MQSLKIWVSSVSGSNLFASSLMISIKIIFKNDVLLNFLFNSFINQHISKIYAGKLSFIPLLISGGIDPIVENSKNWL